MAVLMLTHHVCLLLLVACSLVLPALQISVKFLSIRLLICTTKPALCRSNICKTDERDYKTTRLPEIFCLVGRQEATFLVEEQRSALENTFDRLTCCAGVAAAHTAASAAGTQDCEGTSPSACPAGSWPGGWRADTAAAAAAGGPRGRSPAPSWSCLDSGSSTCGRRAYPWVWGVAAGRCGTPVHHPPHPGTRTDGFQGLRAVVHTPCRRAPTTGLQCCCRCCCHCCSCCWELWFLLQPWYDGSLV